MFPFANFISEHKRVVASGKHAARLALAAAGRYRLQGNRRNVAWQLAIATAATRRAVQSSRILAGRSPV